MIYWICKILLLIIARPYFRVRGVGTHNIPRRRAVLFVSNHASYLDPPLIGMMIPGSLYYLAKKELFDVPFLSWLLRHIKVIPIKRGGLDRKSIQTCRDLLSSGKSLLIFPEGTRTKDGNLQEFKPGIYLLIKDLPEISLVPVYIDGSFLALPRNKKFPRPVKLTVYFGKPFKIDQKGVEMKKKDYYKFLSNLIYGKILSLKNHIKSDMGLKRGKENHG